MKLFGLEITRTKALPGSLSPVSGRGGWWPVVREAGTGFWQRNIEVRVEDVLTNPVVYACIRLIASDIGKLHLNLVEEDANGIWNKTESPAFSPVLRRPNHFSTRNAFFEQWMFSKLIRGNTYVLKQRDQRGVVTSLYVLDPQRVTTLVAPNGDVYYQLQQDDLSRQSEPVTVPMREIIHDEMTAFYHPLFGLSPIFAAGMPATEGLRIQENSSLFFGNGSNPGGVLTADGLIDEETRQRLEAKWQANYSGVNYGRVAVLGSGLKYEPMPFKAVDAQMVEQWQASALSICTAFGVPAFKVGVGPAPAYNNIEALNQAYYSDCLQTHIEKIEALLDHGLELPKPFGTEFDLDDLIRMDTPARVKAAADAIGSGAASPNEARLRWLDLGPVTGGETPYLQQQNYSLSALSKRDAQNDPFAKETPRLSAPEPEGDELDDADTEKAFLDLARKDLELMTA